MQAANATGALYILTDAGNLPQQRLCSLQNLRNFFSGRHYACDFNKNWSSLIKSRTNCLSKILLPRCVYYFMEGIKKKTCTSFILELYKHLGILKNIREVREALDYGSCSSKFFSPVLKTCRGLI